jgi:hypothetical protein
MRSSPTPSACRPLRCEVRSCCSVDTRAYPTSSSFIHQRWDSRPCRSSSHRECPQAGPLTERPSAACIRRVSGLRPQVGVRLLLLGCRCDHLDQWAVRGREDGCRHTPPPSSPFPRCVRHRADRVLLRGTMQGRIPVTDFQDWVSWRRLVVAALDEISAELGCDVVVPQTVVVERYLQEIAAGLSQPVSSCALSRLTSLTESTSAGSRAITLMPRPRAGDGNGVPTSTQHCRG